MAEDEGFEPPLGFPRLSVFKTDPFSRTWVIFRVIFKLQPYFINYWWTLLDLNQWPSGYEPDALTNWAKGPLIMVAGARFELATFRVWTERSNQLSYPAVKKWWTLSGSNRRPPACKAGALPAELRAHKKYNGREDRIRTCDPSVPNRMLYQAEPLPDTTMLLLFQ